VSGGLNPQVGASFHAFENIEVPPLFKVGELHNVTKDSVATKSYIKKII
jgi:hypothetical protein